MLKRMLLIAILVGGAGILFILLNIEIFNRINIIEAGCKRRIGEEAFTPDHFTVETLDTTPYLMPAYQTITFSSRDGIRLSGFYIPAAITSGTPQETVIIVHGFNDCKRRPFSLFPAGILTHNGFNSLVIDLRNHGDSGITGGRMSGGVDEAQDVLGAWDWLVNIQGIPPEKIGVFGYSLGGASIIHAMSLEPHLVAGWSDSAFDNMDRILQSELHKAGLPPFLSTSALWIGRLLFGVDLISTTTDQALQNLDGRPLYIVHSQDDEIVPLASAKILAQATNNDNPDALIWYTDQSTHVATMFDYPEEYEQRLVGFFRHYLTTGS